MTHPVVAILTSPDAFDGSCRLYGPSRPPTDRRCVEPAGHAGPVHRTQSGFLLVVHDLPDWAESLLARTPQRPSNTDPATTPA